MRNGQLLLTPKKTALDEIIAEAEKRIAAGKLTMSQLSEDSGVARPYLYRLFAREQSPNYEIVEKLAAALGMKIKAVRAS